MTMKIDLSPVTIREITAGYLDKGEHGVVAFEGNLDVRPQYQREFVYKDEQRDAVIHTVLRGFPLGDMYWAVNGEKEFEVLDGQQRTLSICQYVSGLFSVPIDGHQMAFHNLTPRQQSCILDYEMMVYRCDGDDEEKMAWFETINIAGVPLTRQELLNAVYRGPWLDHAKSIFSRTNAPAGLLSKGYVKGKINRQAILEAGINWISQGNIDKYMSVHQHDANADELWDHFQKVIAWVKVTFTTHRQEMQHPNWGALYDEFHHKKLNPARIEQEVKKLMMDDDVTNKKGIYAYVLSRDERHLSIRFFPERMRREAYERQNRACPDCKKKFRFEAMEGDHILAWSKGGRTIAENCAMRCGLCNSKKSNR